jgi:hypothetical protein
LAKLRNPKPTRLILFISKLIASVGPAHAAGGEVGEQLRFPGADRPPEPFQFGDAGERAGLVEGVQPLPGPLQVRGGVDVAQFLAGDVGGGDFPVRVAGIQAGDEPGVRLRSQVLRAAEQHPADAVERVAFAAAMAVGVLLDAAADPVDRVLRQPDRVERVQNDGRRGRLGVQRPLIAAEGIERGDLQWCDCGVQM